MRIGTGQGFLPDESNEKVGPAKGFCWNLLGLHKAKKRMRIYRK